MKKIDSLNFKGRIIRTMSFCFAACFAAGSLASCSQSQDSKPVGQLRNPDLFEDSQHKASSGDPDDGGGAEKKKPAKVVVLPSGLQYLDLEEGFGLSPSRDRMAMVHYTGYLPDGSKFESSLDRGLPFSFIVGSGKIIKGIEQGIMGMKVGGVRRLTIPPELGYGAEGHGDKIPPNATLTYEIRLLSCDR